MISRPDASCRERARAAGMIGLPGALFLCYRTYGGNSGKMPLKERMNRTFCMKSVIIYHNLSNRSDERINNGTLI